jgi:hypothetical protein
VQQALRNYTSPATHDLVDGDGVADCTPASGTQFALGDTTVTCNATDAHGNAATPTTFTVHVVDTTAPTIICPPNVSVILGQPISLGTPTVSDLVIKPDSRQQRPQVPRWARPMSSGRRRMTPGNSSSCTQTVTVSYNFNGFSAD